MEALALENWLARSRTLVSVAIAAAKLLETGELEDRVAALESAVRAQDEAPVFDAGRGNQMSQQRRLAYRVISPRYFGGAALLFPEDAETLAKDVLILEDEAACYLEGVVDLLPKGKQTELRDRTKNELTTALAGVVDQRVEYLVDWAKAETLRLWHEENQAADLMAKYT